MAEFSAETKVSDNNLYQYFNSFKEFIRYQQEGLKPAKYSLLYDAYKQNFRFAKFKQTVLESFSSNPALKLFYSSSVFHDLALNGSEAFQLRQKKFLDQLASNTFDNTNLSDSSAISKILNDQQFIQLQVGRTLGYAKCANLNTSKVPAFVDSSATATGPSVLFVQIPTNISLDSLIEFKNKLVDLEAFYLLPCFLNKSRLAKLNSLINCDISELEHDLRNDVLKVKLECYHKQSMILDNITGSSAPVASDAKSRTERNLFIPYLSLQLDFKPNVDINQTLITVRSLGEEIGLPNPQVIRNSDTLYNTITVVSDYQDNTEVERDVRLATSLVRRLDQIFSYNIPAIIERVQKLHDTSSTEPFTGLSTTGQPVVNDLSVDHSFQTSNTDDTFVSEANSGNSIQDCSTSTGKSSTASEVIIQIMQECNINTNISDELLDRISSLPLIKQLDILIIYLAKVHYYDFYRARFNRTSAEYLQTNGNSIVRISHQTTSQPNGEANSSFTDDYKQRIYYFLNLPIEEMLIPVNEVHPIISESWNELCDENILPEGIERYKCSVCNKMFKGTEFVKKHLRNKHDDMLNSLIFKLEGQYCYKFVSTDIFGYLFCPINYADYTASNAPIKTKETTLTRSHGAAFNTNNSSNNGRYNNSRRSYRNNFRNHKREWDAPRTRLEAKARANSHSSTSRYVDL